MDVFPKYIVEDGALILSKVTYHHQLVTDKTKVKGGGWFRRDEKGDFIFHGNSHDFGMASLEDVRECIMNDQVFTNKFSDHSIATKHRFYYDTQTEILLITTLLNK